MYQAYKLTRKLEESAIKLGVSFHSPRGDDTSSVIIAEYRDEQYWFTQEVAIKSGFNNMEDCILAFLNDIKTGKL